MSVEKLGVENEEKYFSSLPIVEDLQIPTQIYTGVEVIGGGAVHYTLEIPDEIHDPVPLGIISGYMGVEAAYGKMRGYVAGNGKPAFTISPHRTQDSLTSVHPSHFFHPQRLLSQGVWGAVRNIQKRKDTSINVEQIDLTGHSMGGFVGALAAEHIVSEHNPELVRSLILNASAGLEPHTVKEFLSHRIPHFTKRELIPAILRRELHFDEAKDIIEEMNHIFLHPRRTLAEGITVGNCNIQRQVVQLGELGVKTAILGYLSDWMLPIEKTLEHSGDLVQTITIFPYIKAGHLAPQIYPKEVGATHLQILEDLHPKRAPNKRERASEAKKVLPAAA